MREDRFNELLASVRETGATRRSVLDLRRVVEVSTPAYGRGDARSRNGGGPAGVR